MAVSDELFKELNDKVTDLNAIVDTLYPAAKSFITDQMMRLESYGVRVFMSPRQIRWIRDLHSKFCGTAEARPAKEEQGVDEQMRRNEDPGHGVRRDDDLDDEVPF
jgi:hypothetical protein